MKTELEQALEDLHDFRQFVLNNATQWKLGASHHNPMWQRIAERLDAGGKNDGPPRSEPQPYFQYDPAYYLER